jgi:hypothetical protein
MAAPTQKIGMILGDLASRKFRESSIPLLSLSGLKK